MTDGDERSPDPGTASTGFQTDGEPTTVGRRRLLKSAGAGTLLGTSITGTGTTAAQTAAEDPTVYVGTDRETTPLVAVNAETGTKAWEFSPSRPTLVGGSPTVVDGQLYVGATSDDESRLYALDAADGTVSWEFADGSSTFGVNPTASPTVLDGTVYTGRYALDAETGEQLWETDLGVAGKAPQVVDGRVYVGTFQPETGLYAIDAATGDRLWSFTDLSGSVASPTVFDGTAYIIETTEEGALYAVDALTGERLWTFTDLTDNVPEAIPTVDGDRVYIRGASNTVYAVDAATGEREWAYTAGSGRGVIQTSPTVADGRVYTTLIAGGLYAIDAQTGDELWQARVDAQFSSPTVFQDTVYVGGDDSAALYAIDAATGDQRWTYDLSGDSNANRSAPTVVSDPSGGKTTGSRVRLGTLGHHDVWARRAGSALSVTTTDGTLLSGTTDELRVAVTNETDELKTGLSISASAESDVATVESATFFEGGDVLDAGESATAVIEVTTSVPPTKQAEIDFTLDVTAAGLSGTAGDIISAVAIPALSVAIELPPSVGIVEPGSEVPVDFVVQANERESLTDVEVRPNLSALPGDWSVAVGGDGQIPIDTGRRPAGGTWSDVGETPVWTVDALGAAETQRPGLTLSVPADAPEGTIEVTPTARADSGRGTVTLEEVNAGGVDVERTYFSIRATVEEGRLTPGEATPVEATMFVEDSISDPEVALGIPDGFQADGSAADVDDGGTVTVDDGVVRFSWSGDFDSGAVLTGAVPVTAPSDQAGLFSNVIVGSVLPGATVSQTVSPAQEERRQRRQSVSYNVPSFDVFMQRKRATVSFIDDTSVAPGFADLTDRETALLDDLEAMVPEDLTRERGERILERLLWSEGLGSIALDLFRSEEDVKNDPRLARRMASNILSGAVNLLLSVLTPLKIVGKVGSRFLASRFVEDSTEKCLRVAGRFLLDEIEDSAKKRSAFVINAVLARPLTDTGTLLAEMGGILDGITDVVEEFVVRDALQERPVSPGRRFSPPGTPLPSVGPSLRDSLTRTADEGEQAIETGAFPGDHTTAQRVFDATRGGIDRTFRTVSALVEDAGESFVTELQKVNEGLQQPETAPIAVGTGLLDQLVFLSDLAADGLTADEVVSTIRARVNFMIQVVDAVISFFGPFHALLLNLAGLEAIHWLSVTGMRGVREGSLDPSDIAQFEL